MGRRRREGFTPSGRSLCPPTSTRLQGPLEGVVQLPAHIDTSARASYDLADQWDREMVYRIVILEGWRDEDFAAWLNRDALVEL